MSANRRDRELRLKKLLERELEPRALEQVTGGRKQPSRYCVPNLQ